MKTFRPLSLTEKENTMMRRADTTIAFTTRGPVRGSCGHIHATEEAAEACCERDLRAVRAGHGRTAYSDRVVVLVTLRDALSLDRIPWALIQAAGVDLGSVRRDAAAHGDSDLVSRAAKAISRSTREGVL